MIPALRRQGQADLSKFEASLGYVVSSREREGWKKGGKGKRGKERGSPSNIPSAILKLSSYFHGILPAL